MLRAKVGKTIAIRTNGPGIKRTHQVSGAKRVSRRSAVVNDDGGAWSYTYSTQVFQLAVALVS